MIENETETYLRINIRIYLRWISQNHDWVVCWKCKHVSITFPIISWRKFCNICVLSHCDYTAPCEVRSGTPSFRGGGGGSKITSSRNVTKSDQRKTVLETLENSHRIFGGGGCPSSKLSVQKCPKKCSLTLSSHELTLF